MREQECVCPLRADGEGVDGRRTEERDREEKEEVESSGAQEDPVPYGRRRRRSLVACERARASKEGARGCERCRPGAVRVE